MASPKPAAAENNKTTSAPLAPIVTTLKKRADYVRAARAYRQSARGLILQGRARRADEPVKTAAIRVGFTCSRKVGGAVARNRAKRRLRALARLVLPETGRPGWDYVLIGRAVTTADQPFAGLRADLEDALERLHRSAG